MLVGRVWAHRPFVEIFLNDVSRGTSPCAPGDFATGFKIAKWVPGNLTAIGRASPAGPALATHTIITAGDPVVQ